MPELFVAAQRSASAEADLCAYFALALLAKCCQPFTARFASLGLLALGVSEDACVVSEARVLGFVDALSDFPALLTFSAHV